MLKLWGKIADRLFWFYVILFVIVISVLYIPNLQQLTSYRLRAQELYETGITEANTIEAIGLLLQMQIRATIYPSWSKAIILGCILLGVIVPIRPGVVIGIGKGLKKLRMWKLWYRIIQAIIALAFTSFILPYVVEFVNQYIIG